jgi:hypothetical protein
MPVPNEAPMPDGPSLIPSASADGDAAEADAAELPELPELPDLVPLYRLQFSYVRAWSVHLGGVRGGAGASYSVAHGRCVGHINGEFGGENRPQHGEDGSTIPDFTGVIVTEDGATIAVETAAYRHTYLVDRRRMLVAVRHVTDDERYARLNAAQCIGIGEVDVKDSGRIDITLDVAEAVAPGSASEPD